MVAKLQHLYHDIAVQLTGSQDLPPIAVRQGLKQGCPASPLLFSLLFDRVAAYVQAAVGALPTAAGNFYTFHTLQLLLLLFADDVALLARSEAGLGRLYRAFKGFCSQNHLTISSAKTKAMVQMPGPPPATITLDGDTYEVLPTFTYLGVTVTPTG